ncbi:unnamed protein product [Urochloa humidicola]
MEGDLSRAKRTGKRHGRLHLAVAAAAAAFPSSTRHHPQCAYLPKPLPMPSTWRIPGGWNHGICYVSCLAASIRSPRRIDATSRAPSVFSVHNVGVQDPGYQVIDGYIWGLLSRNYLQRTVNLSAPHMMDIRLQVKRLKCLEGAVSLIHCMTLEEHKKNLPIMFCSIYCSQRDDPMC